MPVSKEKASPAPDAMEREIEIVRIFDAPVELLFRAWTEPALLAQWFGPRMFTNQPCGSLAAESSCPTFTFTIVAPMMMAPPARAQRDGISPCSHQDQKGLIAGSSCSIVVASKAGTWRIARVRHQ